MADGLQPTGVDLQAKVFQEYLAQLKKVDAEQRKVFDTQFKGTELSYKQVLAASKQYERQLANEAKAAERTARARQKELANELRVLQRNERERADLFQKEAARQRGAGGGLGGLGGGLKFAAAGAVAALIAKGAEAAFNLARQAAEAAGESTAAYDELADSVKTVSLQFGEFLRPAVEGSAGWFGTALDAAGQFIGYVGAGIEGLTVLFQEFTEAIGAIANPFERFEKFKSGEIGLDQLLLGFDVNAIDDAVGKSGEILDEAARRANERFEDITSQNAAEAEARENTKKRLEEIEKEKIAAAEKAAEAEKRRQEQSVRAQQAAVRQAEQIQRNYTRALEDAARNQAKAQAKLAEQQAKARDDLLKKQAKDFDRFQADAIKDTQRLEKDRAKDEAKLRRDAARQQIDAQRQLQNQLRQAEEQFNLARLQSKRRFQLQDRRLQAEGDILGLQQLREDFDLQQQEEKESFNLSQQQAKDSAAEEQLEQARALDDQLKELQASFEEQRTELTTNLDERRAELLASYDEELANLDLAQQEQRDELNRSYQEQLDDLRLNKQRQLEDLGASFAEQEGITKEGAQKIADQLEAAFGEEGIADQIMTNFTERQASSFQQLFDDIGQALEAANQSVTPSQAAATDISRRYPQLQRFDEGGVVPGPVGSPQPILAHGGEQVLTMQQQRVLAPAIASATFRHELAGSLSVTSSGPISDAQIDVISERVNRDVVETFKLGLDRVKRRTN